jgi:hypothetical protein
VTDLLIMIGGSILAIISVFFYGRVSGANAERAKQDADKIESINAKKEIRDEVESLGPADLDKRFERWVSDNKR